MDWVRYHTGGKGNFVTTAMEDTGTLQSLTFLAKTGKADVSRVLVLRTASSFDMPEPGVTAAENLARMKLGAYSAPNVAWGSRLPTPARPDHELLTSHRRTQAAADESPAPH